MYLQASCGRKGSPNMVAVVIISILRHTLGLEVWEFWVKSFERRNNVFNRHGSFMVLSSEHIKDYTKLQKGPMPWHAQY